MATTALQCGAIAPKPVEVTNTVALCCTEVRFVG